MTETSDFNLLPFATIRIETQTAGGETGYGTGFFFNFQHPNNEQLTLPTIVTNKHVIKDADKATFFINSADEKGNRLDGQHQKIEVLDFERRFIQHPDPKVDLCVLPISYVLRGLKNMNVNPSAVSLLTSMIPTQETMSSLGSLEDIIMIGYPIGLWDEVNNRPIIRKGITATHPNLNYNGKEEFLIDAACFPGSSGSPVFLYRSGFFPSDDGRTVFDVQTLLLGILYAGPQFTIEGDIRVVNVPTQQIPISISRIPANLGYVIKSQKLLDFQPIIEKLAKEPKQKLK